MQLKFHRHFVKSVLPPVASPSVHFFSHRLFLTIMCKDDVIHKTGSTKRIAAPPEKYRATAVGNIRKN